MRLSLNMRFLSPGRPESFVFTSILFSDGLEIVLRHFAFDSGTSGLPFYKPTTFILDEPEVESRSALLLDFFPGEIEQLSDPLVPLPVLERG
jgi:hypothetical protein